jgi:flavin reductase
MSDTARLLPFPTAAVPRPEGNDEGVLYKGGMRRLASGVSIITTELDGARYGMAVTSVTSVSASPPTLLVCIASTASSHAPIRAAKRFCVNVLGQSERDVAERFTTQKDHDARFAGRRWASLVTGAPALEGCLASFDCEVSQELEASSHTIFFGRVVQTKLWDETVDPLLYWDRAFR